MSNSTDHPWDHINPAGFPTPELPNDGYRVWLALVIMVITSGLVVLARISTRVVARQTGSDDYAILAAMVSLFQIQIRIIADIPNEIDKFCHTNNTLGSFCSGWLRCGLPKTEHFL